MSQITFRAGINTECLVGWDPPLETFFGQVYKTDEEGRVDVYEEGGEEKDGTIHWVGATSHEIPTIDELESKLFPHVQMLPGEVRKKLNLILTIRPIVRTVADESSSTSA